MVLSNGEIVTEHHEWRNPRWAKAKTRHRFTGRSMFPKRGSQDLSESDKRGSVPIKPDTTEGMQVALAGMRTQLAAAQRQDPRLNEIIQQLRGAPLGSYLAEPRGREALRAQTRAYNYRLASDKVLVARVDGDSVVMDRPVVPDQV